MIIRLPEDLGLRVHARGTWIDRRGTFKASRREYFNEQYGKSAVNLRLDISGAIGKIELRTDTMARQ